MFLTLEEMTELKAQYEKEMFLLQAKIEVVNDLMAIAQSKESAKSEEDVVEETEVMAETPATEIY